MPFLDSISRTRGDFGQIERAVRREIVQGDCRKADVAAQAFVALRQQMLACGSERCIQGCRCVRMQAQRGRWPPRHVADSHRPSTSGRPPPPAASLAACSTLPSVTVPATSDMSASSVGKALLQQSGGRIDLDQGSGLRGDPASGLPSALGRHNHRLLGNVGYDVASRFAAGRPRLQDLDIVCALVHHRVFEHSLAHLATDFRQ